MIKIGFILILLFTLTWTASGCSHKKVVVKNCDQAANSGLWVCDPI